MNHLHKDLSPNEEESNDKDKIKSLYRGWQAPKQTPQNDFTSLQDCNPVPDLFRG